MWLVALNLSGRTVDQVRLSPGNRLDQKIPCVRRPPRVQPSRSSRPIGSRPDMLMRSDDCLLP